jgi:hypothetical protein
LKLGLSYTPGVTILTGSRVTLDDVTMAIL